MNSAQLNYTNTKKELLAIIFALDKFCSYLLGSKIIIFSNHEALQCEAETNSGMLLLQEFDIKIKDKKSVENSMVDHLSRIEKESDPMSIRDDFPDQ
ncbi:Retrovirus-related Pol polyprotein, partial [Mucuna pruriens]